MLIRSTRIGLVPLSVALVVFSVSTSARQAAPPTTPAPVVCSLSWTGQQDAIEDYMRVANVVKLEAVPIGVTKPQRAVFEPGGLVRRAAWKPLTPSYRGGYRESYKAEMAAYKLDRLLDLNMVPPVVERKMSRITGALVYWIENTRPWDVKNPPASADPEWSRRIARMRLFDQLVLNIDRNAGNLLYDDDWHLFLIDHSRAFTERKDLKGPAVPARIDRAMWNRIESLTPDEWQAALGPWLTQGEMTALMARRDRIRDQIKAMVATRGESVFF